MIVRKHSDIQNGVFYKDNIGRTIKVVDKDYIHSHMSNTIEILVEIQDIGYDIRSSVIPHTTVHYAIMRESWDTMPREEEPANFRIKPDILRLSRTMAGKSSSTDSYECAHCTEDGIPHKLEHKGVHEPYLGYWRVCTGCGRKDGIWTPYGDDN